MIFSDLVKSPRTTFTKFRNSFPHGVQPPLDFDPDLVSRDKVKNREAVNRYLAERVRNDWEFTWPPVVNSASASAEPAASAQDEKAQTANGDPQEAGDGAAAAVEDAPRDPGAEADPESDAESVYSTISEDTTRFRPRAEWTSDLSDDDEPCPSASPFRFGSPDAVGAAVRESIEMKRARRRRAVREEMKWNPGLACFEARRNAWTGAKTVRVKPKPPSPVSPSSARRLFWRHHRTQSSISHSAVVASGSPPGPSSPVSPTATRTSTTTASDSDSGAVQRTVSRDSTAPRVLHPVQTVVPVAPPLLPPQNPMRASVQPAMYSSLYDKVVTQSLQPACPVNLSDMLRACVVGWKRDGEWPPKSVYPAPAPVEASNAQVLAVRQQKAQQQRNKNAAAAEAAASKGRRLSLVGLFGTGGGTGGGNKTASRTTTTPAATQEANGANNKESKEDELRRSQSNDDVAGSSGKTLFRRSLQRVLSLGQHGHAHGAVSGNGVEGPLSPTSPTTKEVTAAT
ncbi:hypothetical protein MYCTH_2311847 [Thermothelomyces thermophilus ATCC 42464]|uniref:Gag1-like clamp domain-containing protein n=1 Tax=Thermothelomyces thermophilus (strain ATCC 42464 / BCRC 31852 / DSM 1799) TaxID=573729 RepID=G2QPQ4_THET4|nr:uncharacterized protein MYCTH_2311847 [Thermothelomyces thermophilus ATCC 42464]AEO61567.1 hypothetical protein MYCTH_2311847 [Thermothelomyces thermophilus ATCC 42464]